MPPLTLLLASHGGGPDYGDDSSLPSLPAADESERKGIEPSNELAVQRNQDINEMEAPRMMLTAAADATDAIDDAGQRWWRT